MSRVVEFLRRHGCEAVLTDGAVETNRNGVTTVHGEAMTDRADGVVYVCDTATLPAADIAAHEIVHVHEIFGTESYVAYEGTLLDNLLWDSIEYRKFATWINENYYDGKQEFGDLSFTEKVNRELLAYVNAAIAIRPAYATENFSAMFSDWNAVVEASRAFNAAIGADYSSIMDSSLPSSDGTGRDSYTQNTESERRIREMEHLPAPYIIAKAMMEQGNPQQTAVGVDSRAQNTGAMHDRGVAIGVRPSAMDDAFKRMSARQRQKLYAELEAHTGAKIVEDPTLLADGEYDPKTQTIRINPNRATPMTVIKHELTHYIESSGILYQDFMNYALKSKAFDSWLESKGKTRTDLLTETAARYRDSGVQLDEFGSLQEVLANFTAEVLFTDINALRELCTERPTLFQRLKHFVLGIINKFRGTPAETDLQHLERMFTAAVERTQNAPIEGGKKFSIQLDSVGNEVVVVDTDQGIFVGAEPSEYSRIMRQYFNERFKGVTLPLGNNGDAVSMSKKLPGEYAYPHTALHNQSPEYRAKMKAITELDNLLLTARNHYYSRDTKGNPEATFGWDYYDVEFLCDGMQVSGLINIANSEKGRVFYDITKIKVAPAISERYVALLAHSPFASQEATDTFRITENHPGVNTQYTQDGTKKFIAPETSVGYRSAAEIRAFENSGERLTQNTEELAEMEAVYTVPASALEDSGKPIAEIYREFFTAWGGRLFSKELGEIDLKESSIRSERRHGNTTQKIAAIEAIPAVVEKGKVIFADYKPGTDVQRIVVTAPITIAGKPFYMGVMIQRDTKFQRLYLHDVAIEEEASTFSQADLSTTGADENGERFFTTSILQHALQVKQRFRMKRFIAPETTVQIPGNQLTDEELLAEMHRRGLSNIPNPLQTAQLKTEDAITTPTLRRNGRMNAVGDGESAFAGSVQGADIFSDELKQLVDHILFLQFQPPLAK